MSQQFLKDFYTYWLSSISIDTSTHSSNNATKNNITAGSTIALTEAEKLEPDLVASVLLKQKNAWSVTRRYLTSHSILVGNTMDAGSISNLFERIAANATNATNTSSVADLNSSITKDTTVDNSPLARLQILKGEKPSLSTGTSSSLSAEASSSVMEPARYLPRCLEPHRSIWQDKNEEDESRQTVDIYHWEFFNYDLCPESDVFPCKEGQLEEYSRRDPYLRKILA